MSYWNIIKKTLDIIHNNKIKTSEEIVQELIVFYRELDFELNINPKIDDVKIEARIQHKENTAENQKNFEQNEPVFRGQCKTVMNALKRGEKLTVVSAMQKYNIGDLRRRIKDLKDNYKVTNIDSITRNRSKIWFLS